MSSFDLCFPLVSRHILGFFVQGYRDAFLKSLGIVCLIRTYVFSVRLWISPMVVSYLIRFAFVGNGRILNARIIFYPLRYKFSSFSLYASYEQATRSIVN